MNSLKQTSKIIIAAMLIALANAMFISCEKDDSDNNNSNEDKVVKKAPKYVFFFIGDGMAAPQVNITEAALADPDFSSLKGTKTLGDINMRQFPVTGMSTTHAEGRYITGSAASATALATGFKTTIGTISQNGNKTKNLKTMAEMAKEKGMKVGIVSSVSIDHATPACFYAHQKSRGDYYEIASQMSTSNFDYFGGGFAKGNKEKYGAADIPAKMKAANYKIVTTRSELQAASGSDKVWAYNHTYDGDMALYYEMDRPQSHLSLSEFTKEGIRLLDNDKGFFMMVEGGKIDWACHANDVVAATHDMIAFDEAIGEALKFYNEHKDETLIVITGDHECGGLTLGYAATGYESVFDILKYQKVSQDVFTAKVLSWKESKDVTFTQALDSLKKYYGLNDKAAHEKLELSDYEKDRLEKAFKLSMETEDVFSKDEKKVLFGYYDPFTVTASHILSNKAGIDWTSFKHTGIPVPVFSIGVGCNNFSGYYDNTDIAKKIMSITELK